MYNYDFDFQFKYDSLILLCYYLILILLSYYDLHFLFENFKNYIQK